VIYGTDCDPKIDKGEFWRESVLGLSYIAPIDPLAPQEEVILMSKFRARSPLSYFIRLGLGLLLVSGLLSGCNHSLTPAPPKLGLFPSPVVAGKLAEVATPLLIEQLRPSLEQYKPQVRILSPQPEEILKETKVAVKLEVQDLPLFQNPDLEMGPHVHLILDNQPYQAIYDIEQPIILSDLTPGTHTLRAFPVRPWHESFKNDGAYAQTTFHVLTPTEDNRPNPALPLLTYSRPKGSYGAEPILLDFYLSNAPLHLVAQEDPTDAIADWRIRVTINNESFLLDHWQPIYLKGFEPGQNWIKLEFIDEQGNLVSNSFNNTVRVIDYHPQGTDTLSRLVRGELPLAIAKGMVDNTPSASVLLPDDQLPPPEEISSPNLPLIDSPAVFDSIVPTPVTDNPLEPIVPAIEPEKAAIPPSVENPVQTQEQETTTLPLVEPNLPPLEEKKIPSSGAPGEENAEMTDVKVPENNIPQSPSPNPLPETTETTTGTTIEAIADDPN
jgi:hypothetical protein